MRLYVASSWRNWGRQQNTVGWLREIGHEVYDFMHLAGFESDFGAMQWADAGVLLLPCGRSAHLEAGWFVGAGKPLYIVLDEAEFPTPTGASNPELMYRMATRVVVDVAALVDVLGPEPVER